MTVKSVGNCSVMWRMRRHIYVNLRLLMRLIQT